MKPETRNALLRACSQLNQIIGDLYQAHDNAVGNNDDEDASLLASRADKLYEELENLELIVLELEER